MSLSKTVRSKPVTKTQQEMLVNFMLDHRSFAVGSFDGADSRAKSQKMWGEVSVLLNNADPNGSIKTPEKWQKCWQDMRSKAKSRGQAQRLHMVETGGGEPVQPLSDMDETIIAITGEEVVHGLDVPESGANYLNERNVMESWEKENMPGPSRQKLNMPGSSENGNISRPAIGKVSKKYLAERNAQHKEARKKPYTRKAFFQLQEQNNVHCENIFYALHRLADTIQSFKE